MGFPALACTIATSLAMAWPVAAAPPADGSDGGDEVDDAPADAEVDGVSPGDDQEPAHEDDDTRARASELFQAGSKDYMLGSYVSAIEKFEEAYRLTNEPEMLYNLAQAYWKKFDVEPSIDNLRKARVLFKNYQKVLGSAGEHSDTVAAFIDDLEQQIESTGAVVEEEPEPEDPEPLPSPSPEDDAKRALGPLGHAGVAMAIAGAIGGASLVGVGLISRSRLIEQRKDEEDHPAYDSARKQSYQTNIGKAEVMTYVSAGVGGALLVTGVVFIVVDAARRKNGKTSTAWRPQVGPGALSMLF